MLDLNISMLGSKYSLGHDRAQLGGEANFGFPWTLNCAL